MALGQVPLAQGRGFIVVIREMDAVGYLRQRSAEIQIIRSREYRVSTENRQRFNLAGVHCIGEFRNGLNMGFAIGVLNVVILHGAARAAKRIVEYGRQRVDHRVLMMPNGNNRLPLVGKEIGGHRTARFFVKPFGRCRHRREVDG